MQTTKLRSILIGSAILAVAIGLFSFSRNAGGDSLEIYLNKKLVMQQYLHMDPAVKTFPITASDNNKQLEIYYRHCGLNGKNRSITIKDGENKILRQWNFDDAATAMAVTVKDIPGRVKNKENKVFVYYQSKELPKGKLLVNLVLANETIPSGRAR